MMYWEDIFKIFMLGLGIMICIGGIFLCLYALIFYVPTLDDPKTFVLDDGTVVVCKYENSNYGRLSDCDDGFDYLQQKNYKRIK